MDKYQEYKDKVFEDSKFLGRTKIKDLSRGDPWDKACHIYVRQMEAIEQIIKQSLINEL